jgi:putative hydrolase of the HAD superfamily
MKLRAVIFDFGGVVCFPPTEAQWEAAARVLGMPKDAFVREFWRDRGEYDRGGDPALYWRRIAHLAGRTLDQTLLDEMVRREIDFWSDFDERVLAWTGRLRAAGLRTGILSNLPGPLGRHLRALPGFLDHFDQVTFSYELGSIKPERKIYDHAIQGLAIAPREALFLDDKIENVDGAIAAGLNAELFTSWEEFQVNGSKKWPLPQGAHS